MAQHHHRHHHHHRTTTNTLENREEEHTASTVSIPVSRYTEEEAMPPRSFPCTPEYDDLPQEQRQDEFIVNDINIPAPDETPASKCNFSERWSQTMACIKAPLLRGEVFISHHAARRPKTCVMAILVASIVLFLVGISTNFETETSNDVWTPEDSLPVQHNDWIENESGYPDLPRYVLLVLHRDGGNMLGEDGVSLAQEGARRMFQAVEAVRNTSGFDELCSKSDYVDITTNTTTCSVFGITSYWNDNFGTFQTQVSSNDDAIVTMSQDTFPDGRPADRKQIMGYAKFNETDSLSSTLSYVTVVGLTPIEDEAEALERDIIDRLLDLQDYWLATSAFRLELLTERSFSDEYERSTFADLPLVPLAFCIMSALCILVFAKCDTVQSRSLLGVGAVVTVLLAIMSSFGLLFTCGVPFTSLTMILPFILFGVGLDDAFIIAGSYSRTDGTKDPVERIDDTINDVGGTILLTTLTSSSAFALGLVSSIPAVQWLVTYAFPTILIDFVYQITFFVALIVMDEHRIEANRCDCLFCIKVRTNQSDEESGSNEDGTKQQKPHIADELMHKYADWLLKRPVKIVVLLSFPTLLGLCSWSTSQLEQQFDFTDIVPKDSYIITWWNAYENYYENNGARPGVYFRDVDFSNTSTWDQMEDYVNDLANLTEYFAGQPSNFWLRDFRSYLNTSQDLQYMTFEEQVEQFLLDPVYSQMYKDDIARNGNGIMTTSRTWMGLDNVDYDIVTEQIDALVAQREVSAEQPVNQGQSEWPFFTFAGDYFIWEFYRVSPEELTLSVILGTAIVSVLALLFIPHWSAIFFVGPMVVVLYIDLLGVVQWAGLAINPVTYIAMVMSIGLMVDYVMHVTLRFVELPGSDRVVKTKDTLGTIGASVMLGGVSTMLGVLPLAFCSSIIFFSVFVIFFGLVMLGLLHGLVFLPVVLSLVGPVNTTVDEKVVETYTDEISEKEIQDTLPPFSPCTYCTICQMRHVLDPHETG